MTSSIINFIFDNFLSSFVEIDTSKTNVSLLTGLIEMQNVKIKESIFKQVDLPYFELVHGYIGIIRIEMQMPLFFEHPIKVLVDKIFFHAKQKTLENIKKEDAIANMEDQKKKQLQAQEDIRAQINEVRQQNREAGKKDNKPPDAGLVQKIVGNITIDINDIVFRFDDEISNPAIPYSLGIILEKILIRSTANDYIVPKNQDVNIPYDGFNHKVLIIDNFSIFLDTYSNASELEYTKLISPMVSEKIPSQLVQFLGMELRDYYTYCMSEVYVHSRKFDSHQYLLHKFDLLIKVSINDNIQNLKPQTTASISIPQIMLAISLKQIKCVLKVLAYINLNTLYSAGIAKEYYNKELKEVEKKQYVEAYANYFQDKYVEKKNVNLPAICLGFEDHLPYEQIQKMRSAALKKVDYITKIEDVENRIKNEENRLFGKREDILKQLQEEKKRVLENEKVFDLEVDKQLEVDEIEEIDLLKDMNDDYIKLFAIVEILITSFTIYETVIIKPDGGWDHKTKILSLDIQHISVDGRMRKVGAIYSVSFENIIVSQEIIKNPNYSKIFFGDLTCPGKILCIEFEMDPRLKKSDLRCKVWSERSVFIIVSMYSLQYIQKQIMNVLATTIDFDEVSEYAQGAVGDYIQEGYADKLLEGNYTHSNISLDVFLEAPKILMPVDVFDFSNTQCLMISLGILQVKSVLPPRMNPQIDYTKVNEEYLMYDIYRVDISKFKISTIDNCIEKNNYKGIEHSLIPNVDVKIEAAVCVEPKNPYFNAVNVYIIIPVFIFQISEFQILTMIEFLANMTRDGNNLDRKIAMLQKLEEQNNAPVDNRAAAEKYMKKKEDEKNKKKRKNEKHEKFVEDQLAKKRKAVYDKFVHSFVMTSKSKNVLDTIKKIVLGKKSMKLNFVMNQILFSIKKNFIDLTTEDYLVFEIKLLEMELDMTANGDMLVRLMILNTYLYDLDLYEDKSKFYIDKTFQCMIQSTVSTPFIEKKTAKKFEEKKVFLDVKFLNRPNIGEMYVLVDINNLNIIMSIDSIIRLYQFGMYYNNKFAAAMVDVVIMQTNEVEFQDQLGKSVIQRKNTAPKKLDPISKQLQDEYMDRLKNYNFNRNDIDFFRNKLRQKKKYRTFQERLAFWRVKVSGEKGVKSELILDENRTQMRIILNMNNTSFKMPINPNILESPMFSMTFDMIFTMDAYTVSTDISAPSPKKLLETFYQTKNSKMNVSLQNVDMDVAYLSTEGRTRLNPRYRGNGGYTRLGSLFIYSKPEERLLQKFRMFVKIEGYIVTNSELSVMNIQCNFDPIILSIGIRQIKVLMELSNQGGKMGELMEEKYIPPIIPEYVVNGKVVLPTKKKMKFKEAIRRIILKNTMMKILERNVKKMKASKDIKVVIINTDKYNNLMVIEVNIDKISLGLFDNTQNHINLLLEMEITKLYVKMNTNSIVRDKNNISKSLIEIISLQPVKREDLNPSTMSMYIDVFFSFEMNYYNFMTNRFEPMLEPFDMKVVMFQVAPFMRTKLYVITDDVINFNISVDEMRVLNIFLKAFNSNESQWANLDLLGGNNLYGIKSKEEIALHFINYTGIRINIFFEGNPAGGFGLDPKGIATFTKTQLFFRRGLDKKKKLINKTTFCISLLNSMPTDGINFQRNNHKQFALDLDDGHHVYFTVKVESSGLTNVVKISSSLSFVNDTMYDTIFLNINNPNFMDNEKTIIVKKNEREYVPITWMTCDSPNSNVYMKLSSSSEPIMICNHVNEFFVEPILDEEILREKKKKKKEIEEEYAKVTKANLTKIVDAEKKDCDNRKDSKQITFNYTGNIKKYFTMDYYILQSKDVKTLIENNKKENKQITQISNEDYNSSLNILTTGNSSYSKPYYSYEYCILIRPLVIFVNQLPFSLFFTAGGVTKNIPTLEKTYIYETISDSNIEEVKISIEYNNAIYTSNPFYLNEKNSFIKLTSNSLINNTLQIHLLKKPAEHKFTAYNIETKDFSINCYEFIFYSDYLINNRLNKNIFYSACTKSLSSDAQSKALLIPRLSLGMISTPKLEDYCAIKDENSGWSDPFEIDTIGVQGVIKMKTNNISSTDEIACIISNSDIYEYSTVVILEQRYFIINHLGIDIIYKQENIENICPLKNGKYQGLFCAPGKKIFRIGLIDQLGTNYSGPFDIENMEDYDVKIKVSPEIAKMNKDLKVFSYDNLQYYLLVRIINQTYDNGLIYLLITSPLFPYLDIINKTGESLKIYEEKYPSNSFTTLPNLMRVPFIWTDCTTLQETNKICFEIGGSKGSFDYNEIVDGKTPDDAYVYSVKPQNNCSTRSFIINNYAETQKEEINFLYQNKKRPTSSYFDIMIRGFGISFINQVPKELFYFSFYNIQVKFISNVHSRKGGMKIHTTQNIMVYIYNIQLDYCLNDSLQNVIVPRTQIIPSNIKELEELSIKNNEPLVPFLQVCCVINNIQNKESNESFQTFQNIELIIQKFYIKAEQNALLSFLSLYTEMSPYLDFSDKTLTLTDLKEPLLDIETPIPIKKLIKENENAAKMLINHFLLSALNFHITLRLDIGNLPFIPLPKTIKRILGTIGNIIGRISECALVFSEKELKHIYMTPAELTNKLMSPYITEGISQLYKIIGSLDILGNPLRLVKNVGLGFYDLVNEPRKGFKLGPKEFGLGILKGFGGLFAGVFGGVFESFQRISGTLYAATQTLIGSNDHSYILEEDNEPQDVIEGFGYGFYGFGKEIKKGIIACCTKPCQKMQISGLVGCCKGCCSGCLAFIISPCAACFKLLASICAGCKNSCFSLGVRKKTKTKRFRYPRTIIEGEESLPCYEENKAEGKELLWKLAEVDTDNIYLAENFICVDRGLNDQYSMCILTDNCVYVVYDIRKIVFLLKIYKINSCSVHFVDGGFKMCFNLNNGGSKRFSIMKEYSRLAIMLYDYINEIIERNKIGPNDIGNNDSNILNNYPNLGFGTSTLLPLTGNIDKSSYTKTLIDDPSVYSGQALKSKFSNGSFYK